MSDYMLLVGAFVVIIILWTLGSIHRELTGVLTYLKSITTTNRYDTQTLVKHSDAAMKMLLYLAKDMPDLPKEEDFKRSAAHKQEAVSGTDEPMWTG